jgi:hypothetical protein
MRSSLGRVALELGAHGGDVDDVGRLDGGDERAAPRLHGNEVLEREPLDRLAQRGAADLELAHQLVLAQHGARRQAQRDDPVAQLVVRALGEQAARDGVAGGGPGVVGALGLYGHAGADISQ